MTIQKIGKVPKVASTRKVAKLPAMPQVRQVGRRSRWPWQRAQPPLERYAIPGVGTLPERIMEKWLIDEHHLYEAQRPEMGGRMLPGGTVTDFIVYTLAARPVVLRVQGDYWHGPSFPGRRARDDEAAGRLRRRGYLVVDVWEGEIYEAAQAGQLTALVWRSIFL